MANWNKRFLRLARHVAGWSKDPSTQVGAVIVDSKRRIVGMGYNGLPRGVADTKQRLSVRDVKYQLVVHAETNAILNATSSVEDCTIYTWPLPPCNECAKLIIQSGISCVYFEMTEKAIDRMPDFQVSMDMLEEAGIEVNGIPDV